VVAAAKSNHYGELALWEITRDRNAGKGALRMCTNITQTPYEFGKIFAGHPG
jgi:hypothetical protein